MPTYHYVLIALLTSGASAAAPEVIVQPNGGTVLLVAKNSGHDQNTPPVKPKSAAVKGKSGTTSPSTKPFIKLDGIKGESKDKDHKDWIE